MAMVRPATRRTGTRDVIALAVSGWLLMKVSRGVINSAIFVNDDRAHSSDTGNICRSAKHSPADSAHTQTSVNAHTPIYTTQPLTNSDR